MLVIIFAVCLFFIGLAVCLWKTWPEEKTGSWGSERDWMPTFIISLAYSLYAYPVSSPRTPVDAKILTR